MQICRIILADDHVLFRAGIKKIVEEDNEIKIVGEVSDGAALLKLIKTVTPDMVILDISMPNLQGVEATQKIKSRYPHMKVLILTMHRDKEFLHHAISAGADGYLLKEDADTELFTAINTIRSGGSYISPLLSVELASDLVRIYRERFEPPLEHLTLREIEVLRLIAEGQMSKEIADHLCISIRTVHHHRENILRKLNIRNIANLVKYAISKGYTSTFV
ncbi:MAG: response regulator transcription factor [Syntrophobacteraceae bacterium]|jgi:DNA-binding NarL/FixJ family response regulator